MNGASGMLRRVYGTKTEFEIAGTYVPMAYITSRAFEYAFLPGACSKQ